MGKVVYTTDVAHCMGRAYEIRDKCYKYWLRKELCKLYSARITTTHIKKLQNKQ